MYHRPSSWLYGGAVPFLESCGLVSNGGRGKATHVSGLSHQKGGSVAYEPPCKTHVGMDKVWAQIAEIHVFGTFQSLIQPFHITRVKAGRFICSWALCLHFRVMSFSLDITE